MERLALKDGETTTGSSIPGPSSSRYNEDSRVFALAEDPATCGNCKGSWKVGGTAHNWIDEGQAMTKDFALFIVHAAKIARRVDARRY
mgnify:CR=1 FL=1